MGSRGHELAEHEAHEGAAGEHAEGDDEGGVEPVVALAAIEDELEAAEAHHHEDEARASRPGRACAGTAGRRGTRWP